MPKNSLFKLLLLNILIFIIHPAFALESQPKANDQQPSKQSNESSIEENQDVSNYLSEHKDMQFTFLYPIVDEKIKLEVIIPKSFKPLEADPNAELLEFIPKTDQDPYKWSQIITLNKILGSGIEAPDYIQKLQELFIKSTENAKVIEKDKQNHDNYQEASSIIQYNSGGRDEVVIFYSVSGPYDIANVQYALPLSSTQDLKSTVQQLKDFIKNNTKIVKNLNESEKK